MVAMERIEQPFKERSNTPTAHPHGRTMQSACSERPSDRSPERANGLNTPAQGDGDGNPSSSSSSRSLSPPPASGAVGFLLAG
ncbi:hypothetical protein Dda_3972 [Drechslerella dactyloides]|uniref:Uncharacterized protein n=1 Tax=Drechslerella dactyloides TaxID=74499 RepID=A0AAD6IYX0_DREDA|nr:hypothetical protein Dda_3972 [Drechslerella dactyloides]